MPLRGSIDQDPVLVELSPTDSHDSEVATYSTSDDDGTRARERKYGSRLETTDEPVMRRTPSPYGTSTTGFERGPTARGLSRIPAVDIGIYPPSPPRSPRSSQDETGKPSTMTPIRSSVEYPRVRSPQASPKLPSTLPTSVGGWEGAFEKSDPRSIRPLSRSATTARQDDAPRSTARSAPVQRAESLPYPVDNSTAVMPEERDHQWIPEVQRPVATPATFAKTIPRPGLSPTTRPPSQKRLLTKDDTAAFTSTPTPPIGPRGTRTPALFNPMSTTKSIPVKIPIMIPCQRTRFESGHDDWYTLDDCPEFDICEPCFLANFQHHAHKADFQPVKRNTELKIRCDFSRQWLRLAWLLILQRQLPDLSLLKAVFHHLARSDTLDCPETQVKSHFWYTVLDDETRKPILDLHICATDVHTIEILLPSLRGFFVPLPPAKSTRTSSNNPFPIDQAPRLCAFRSTSNNRFQLYLDSIISLHESATHTTPSRLPDMTSFVRVVKHKLPIEPCPRDNILQGAKWYFIPSLPELTVCEDCHDDVVAPLLRKDKDLAMRFNRTPQSFPTLRERGARDSVASLVDVTNEASCALYSNQMREIFMTAVRGNDLQMLVRVAKHRRRVEKELQTKAQPLIARVHELDEEIAKCEARGRRKEEVKRLEQDRETLEEKLMRYHDEWIEWE